jgi:hypothetical protein
MVVSILLLPQINPGFAAEKLVLAKHETQNAVHAAVINPQCSLIFRRPQLLIYKSSSSRNLSALPLGPFQHAFAHIWYH